MTKHTEELKAEAARMASDEAYDREQIARGNPDHLRVGQKVTTSGYAGTIVRQYSAGMFEVRLASGLVCVSAADILPA